MNNIKANIERTKKLIAERMIEQERIKRDGNLWGSSLEL